MLDASMIVGATTSPHGVPFRAFSHAVSADTPALSEAVWTELAEVPARPRLARFVRDELRTELLTRLRMVARWFDPVDAVTDCRDGKHNKYLELALASRAGIIVSSDDDLLVLDPWRGVRILRPRDDLVHSNHAQPPTTRNPTQ